MRRVALGLLLFGCLGHDPGSTLGTYATTGTLTQQTCGASIVAQDPWAFHVRLSRSGSTIFWLQDASPALTGSIDPAGNVIVKTTEIFDLQDASDSGKKPYCGVVRSDTFTASLGTAPQPTGFMGKLNYHYEVDEGADCTAVVAGQFDSLPCDVSYDLAGQRTQ